MNAKRRIDLRLPGNSIAPGLARVGIGQVATGLREPLARDLALLITEVVSNAVRHASRSSLDEVLVRVDATDDVIRVEVHDCGALFDPPTDRAPHDARPNGWGLYLLDRLARAWGVEADGDGKLVWFELDTRES